MTVLTECVRDRAPEIAFLVALPAAQLRMLPDEPELRGVMVEIPAGTIGLPTSGVVTAVALAAQFQVKECAVVGIGVTTLAPVERQPFEESQLLI